ncbi:hypothetical protein EMCRGX_G029111 [Ephydatia muelleri]|eukprot:Em0013g696a
MALVIKQNRGIHSRTRKRKSSTHECVEERASRKRSKADSSESDNNTDEDAELEDIPRHATWEAEDPNQMHFLLPLKTKFGIVHQSAVLREQAYEEDSDKELEEVQETEPSLAPQQQPTPQVAAEPSSPVLTVAQLFARRQAKLDEKKQTIADLSTQIINNPEENIGLLKKLRSLCGEKDADVAITVRKYAMISLAAVVKDITPTYRIQDWKEIDKGVKLSKDVLRLRQFEQSLLSNYRLFLELLDKTVQAGLKEKDKVSSKRNRKSALTLLEGGEDILQSSLQGLAEVALTCLCDLVVSLSHFNFCNNILVILVPRMNSKALDGKVSQLCCGAIEKLFEGDMVGEVSLEAVQLITKMVKGKNYKARPEVLRTFLHLQLQHVGEQVGAQGSYETEESKAKRKELKMKILKMSKGQRKRLKEEKKLDQELRETEAVERTEKKSKFQTETIKLVFLTYFRILKHATNSPLLPSVLEGLAKFAHLINIDFFQDLMSVLHSLAEAGTLSNRECMLCVLTAFEILSGQGAALNIDSRQFYTQLYEATLQLDALSQKEDVVLAMDCLDRMMRKRREVSMLRIFGFVKRLATVSLQVLPGASLAILATIRKFMNTYSQCQQLLDTECIAGELFRPDVLDPEMSRANSTVLWELSLQQQHYEPTVKAFATHVLLGVPSQGKGSLHAELARKTCSELLSISEVTSSSYLAPPHPHPSQRASSNKRGLYYYSDRGLKNQLIQQAASFEMNNSIDFVYRKQ